jgi:hypothetical protein
MLAALPLLDSISSRGVLEAVEEHVEKQLVWCVPTVAIQEAKPRSGLAQPADALSKRIAELMRRYPEDSHRDILGRIDTAFERRSGEIPKRFKKHEHRKRGTVMVGAYDCDECGHSVETFMTEIRKRLGLSRARRSRRP